MRTLLWQLGLFAKKKQKKRDRKNLEKTQFNWNNYEAKRLLLIFMGNKC